MNGLVKKISKKEFWIFYFLANLVSFLSIIISVVSLLFDDSLSILGGFYVFFLFVAIIVSGCITFILLLLYKLDRKKAFIIVSSIFFFINILFILFFIKFIIF